MCAVRVFAYALGCMAPSVRRLGCICRQQGATARGALVYALYQAFDGPQATLFEVPHTRTRKRTKGVAALTHSPYLLTEEWTKEE